MVKMHTRICFKKYDQLWKAFPKFRGDRVFSTWAYRVALNTPLLCTKSKRSIATVEYEGGQHFIGRDYNYEEEQIKLMYKAVYQLNIEKH
jgi:RNA polymerase sigma-70 factor (ECF subfamily)